MLTGNPSFLLLRKNRKSVLFQNNNRFLKELAADCTPDSVISLAEDWEPFICCGPLGAALARRAGSPCAGLALLLRGLALPPHLTERRGALLPHLFTLACGFPPAVCFLLRYPCPGDMAPEPRLIACHGQSPEGRILPASSPVKSGSSSLTQKLKSGSPSAVKSKYA